MQLDRKVPKHRIAADFYNFLKTRCRSNGLMLISDSTSSCLNASEATLSDNREYMLRPTFNESVALFASRRMQFRPSVRKKKSGWRSRFRLLALSFLVIRVHP